MHPLEVFNRFRRLFCWALPGRQPWDRKPEHVAPERPENWPRAPEPGRGPFVVSAIG